MICMPLQAQRQLQASHSQQSDMDKPRPEAGDLLDSQGRSEGASGGAPAPDLAASSSQAQPHQPQGPRQGEGLPVPGPAHEERWPQPQNSGLQLDATAENLMQGMQTTYGQMAAPQTDWGQARQVSFSPPPPYHTHTYIHRSMLRKR